VDLLSLILTSWRYRAIMAHEDLRREEHVEGSSDRAFGLVFAGVFLLIAGSPLIHLDRARSARSAARVHDQSILAIAI
jgi:hypothetical protein